ncbi:MAG TPA: gluconate 2-dehydrogenase subunit 3 family protein [Gemmatimonadaceae bacterium]|nr:gluconate 2-dehydrogenase subunit 3 family protein [Gemmatimonadaceae bacterium]
MSDITRREALGLMAAVPIAHAIELAPPVVDRAIRAAERAQADAEATGTAFTPTFFTAHEWRTVRMLVDYVIPRDERSGSATDAGVPEFMDFIMRDKPDNQTWMRGGLAWMDAQCRDAHGKAWVDCTPAQRTALLDAIAWPKKAKPEMSHGVAFFNRFRDMTSSGFWSSKLGIEDLRYMGNRMMPGWNGCPDEALKKLGVSYNE